MIAKAIGELKKDKTLFSRVVSNAERIEEIVSFPNVKLVCTASFLGSGLSIAPKGAVAQKSAAKIVLIFPISNYLNLI